MPAERRRRTAPRQATVVMVAVVVATLVGITGLVGTTTAAIAQRAPAPATPSQPATPTAAIARPVSGASTPGQPATPTNPGADPVRARQQAEEVFAQDEYGRRTPRDTVIDKALDWIDRQLAKLFDGLHAPEGGKGVNPTSWLLIIALVAFVVFLVWRFRRTMRPKADADDELDVEVTMAQTRPSADWVDEAERAEAAGEWRLGLQARFRALVAELIERGVVASLPGRTVGEFRAEVRAAAPEVGDTFATAGALFERAFYGAEPTGADEATRFAEAAAVVIAAARAHQRELQRARDAAADAARSAFEAVAR